MFVGYDCIRIERERDGFEVSLNDPAIVAANEKNRGTGDCCAPSKWQDPQVSYTFDTKEKVLAFLDKAIDIALPNDDQFTSTFDKLAKAVGGAEDD